MIVPVFVIVLVVVLGVVFLVAKWPLRSKSPQDLEKNGQTLELNGGATPGVITPDKNTERVTDKGKNIPNNDNWTEANNVAPLQLPPENTRMSIIESSMHDLPSTIDAMLKKANNVKDTDYKNKNHRIQSDDVQV